jgi:hypothetical protein
MPPRFLAAENLNAKIIAGLLRRESAIDFLTARAAGILALLTKRFSQLPHVSGVHSFRTIGKQCQGTFISVHC